MQTVDLPTYLATLSPSLMLLEDQCPHCHQAELMGMYDHSIGNVGGPVICTACHWSEDRGCAGARCGSDECWQARTEALSRCCGDPVVFGFCNGCGEHA